MIDVEALLAANGNSCGILDAVNEGQIGAIDEAIRVKPAVTQYKGDVTTVLREAQEPQWDLLEAVADGLFYGGRVPDLSHASPRDVQVEVNPVKHLKVAVLLTRIGLEFDGLPGFSTGLTLIGRLLKEHWEQVYPIENPIDPEDPFIDRINVLAPLANMSLAPDRWNFFESLLAATLLESDRHGTLSVFAALAASAKLKIHLPPWQAPGEAFLQEVRTDCGAAVLDQQRCLGEALAAVEEISRAFENVPGLIRLDLKALSELLRATQATLDASVPEVSEPREAMTASPAANSPAQGVSSREEAVRRLGEIAAFFRATEPSSPMPLLIERVRRLAGLDFMELVKELQLGDQAVHELQKLAGPADSEPS